MEYLEGETLAERLKKGALPLDQALRYAIEIADALDKAHRQGVVHRDLKPGNIMLTKAGAKLLDFGLAKLRTRGTQGTDGFSAATTQSAPLTERGMLMGTVPCMAPEQVQGRDTGARGDLFSFGAVLYEMVTGQRPFTGDNQASLIAKIIEVDPPPVSSLQPITPGALDRVVMTCLVKDPDRRWQTATDLQRQLVWVREGLGDQRDLARDARRPRWRHVAVWSAAGGLALGAIAAWLAVPRQLVFPAAVTRATIELARDQTLDFREGADPLAISPDGKRVAYAASGDGGVQLYVRELDALEARPLPGTVGAQYPFFSPDGEHVAFAADGRLQRVALAGGAPVPIASAPAVSGAGTWSPDGSIVFDADRGLMRVDASGGQPERVVSRNPEINELTHRYPRFLPDGRGLLSTVHSLEGFEPAAVAVLDLRTAEWHVVSVGEQAQYLPTGHVLFHGGSGEEGELHAVPFDLDTMSPRGALVSVLEEVFRARNGGAAYYAISDTGTLVYAPGGLAKTLVRVDKSGHRTPLLDDRLGFRFPRLSPDGGRIAVTIDPRPSEVWVYDLTRGTRVPLSTEGHSLTSAWTADGRRVAYRYGNDIHWRAADGSRAAEPLLEQPDPVATPGAWSADGEWLVFKRQSRESGWDIWVRRRDGEPQPLVATPTNETQPRLSPDGRWLAYSSDESGNFQIYVQRFPNVGDGRWTISRDGGHTPVWAPDGSALYYMNDATLRAVNIEVQGDALIAGVPAVLFDGPYSTTQDNNYDIFPDGEHFLMVEADPDANPSRLHLVLNWFEELKARVPVD